MINKCQVPLFQHEWQSVSCPINRLYVIDIELWISRYGVILLPKTLTEVIIYLGKAHIFLAVNMTK